MTRSDLSLVVAVHGGGARCRVAVRDAVCLTGAWVRTTSLIQHKTGASTWPKAREIRSEVSIALAQGLAQEVANDRG